ncbi:MAG: type 1 glutamine amidotransferase [Pseudomonadota bacterium]
MNVHYLKHVPFEGLGSMENILTEYGCGLTRTCMYEDQSLPSIHDIDALIVMGGPMSVGDEDDYPWLTLEKEFIESIIKREIPVLGICLGAQLIADVLGAPVTKNQFEEIGWFPVNKTQAIPDQRVTSFPDQFYAYHWHGDTFGIPSGAKNFLASEGCANQAFIYGETTLGLQFHLEMLPSNVQGIYQECGNPEKQGEYVQYLEDMLSPMEYFQQANKITQELIQAFIFQKVPQFTRGD